MSRKHKIQTVALLDPRVVVERPDDIVEKETATSSFVEELASTSSNLPTEIEEETEEYFDDDDDTEDDSEEVFLRAVAIMVTFLLR